MAEKNLPIKFFQKRQKDEMATEGGGGGKLPKWANPELIGEKAAYVRKVLSGISRSLAEKVQRNNYVPSVLKLKVNEDALAKTYRREIGNLFNVGKLNIIGVSGEDEVLVKIDNEADLQAIMKKFSNINDAFPTNTTLVGISAIVNAEEFKPQIDVDLEKESVLKVKLFNYSNSELNSILIKLFESYCTENKLSFERAAYSGDLNIYRLSEVSQDALNELKDFDGVKLVTEMPTYDITMDEITEENHLAIKMPKAGQEYPVVGVLDTGIAGIPHLTPWLHNKNFSKYHADDINKRHGTFVAGVLI